MNALDAYYNKMTKTKISVLIIKLGIPTTISMLITNIYNLVDTYFVGSLGESQQAAIGVVFTLQAILQAIGFMLGHGSGTYVSKHLASKDVKKASNYVSTAFYISLFIGVILAVFGLIFLKPFMLLLGSTDTILPFAMDYSLFILLTAPFFIGSLVLNNNLRYEGKALFAMIGLSSGALLNILGDYIFISVLNLGVFGAGLSTGISQIVSFIILLVMYILFAQSKINPKYFKTNINLILEIVKTGFPSLIRQGLTSVSNGILNNLAKPFGDDCIAAMTIVNRFSSFVMCVGMGIGQGYQPVASYNYQAKKYKRVKQGLIFTICFSLVLVTSLSILGFIFSKNIIQIFQDKAEVIEIGSKALRYATIGLIFMPVIVSINMAYQSIRKPLISSILSLLRSGAIFIPVLLITANYFGLTGIQIAQPVSDVITGVISIGFIIYFLKTTPNDKISLEE